MNPHPARTMPFAELFAGLQVAVADKLATEARSDDGLCLYTYSRSCVYDRAWTPITLLARGLILDPAAQQLVATPFPKFFNFGERTDPPPSGGFDTFEKLDGSLIILYHRDGEWRTATKGSFYSSQARWASAHLKRFDLSALSPGTTYLTEAIYPENRIVIRYDDEALVMLAAYGADGQELPRDELAETADRTGWRCARRYEYDSIADLVERAAKLPASDEGYVLRFEDGTRMKIKGDEYRRIHAMLSDLTPLAMWRAMAAGDNLEAIRRELPEEFWGDFDSITTALHGRVADRIARVKVEAEAVMGLTDKEVGLRLSEVPEDARPFIFPYRKQSGDLLTGRPRDALFRAIRPTGNNLPGYVPSYAVRRFEEESL